MQCESNKPCIVHPRHITETISLTNQKGPYNVSADQRQSLLINMCEGPSASTNTDPGVHSLVAQAY